MNADAPRCWGIFRELAHSPGRETDDALILKETARHLEAEGFSVALRSTEDLAEEPTSSAEEPPQFLFAMCERLDVLAKLAKWEARGIGVVNSTEAIRNTYRDRTASLFERNRVSFPRSVLVATSDFAPKGPSGSQDLSGLWIKRGDVHATEAGDVVRATDSAHALSTLAGLARRGVAQALLQEHVAGDLIKFYGVGVSDGHDGHDGRDGRGRRDTGADADADAGAGAGDPWFEWFYHRDQDLRRHPFDSRRLARKAREAAAALGLEIWGGDAIVGPDGAPVVIDLNAWPSFALYRESAGRRIAAHLVSRFRKRVETRTGVSE